MDELSRTMLGERKPGVIVMDHVLEFAFKVQNQWAVPHDVELEFNRTGCQRTT